MGANPAAHLCLRVGSRHQVTFVPYPRRSPLFVIAAGSAQVSLTLPDQLDAEHVEFARHWRARCMGRMRWRWNVATGPCRRGMRRSDRSAAWRAAAGGWSAPAGHADAAVANGRDAARWRGSSGPTEASPQADPGSS